MGKPLIFYLNNSCMMNNAINKGNGHHSVWKDLIPLAEELVRNDDQAATFITMCDKLPLYLEMFTAV